MVALWAWQCVIAAVLLCCALSMTFSAAAAWRAVGGQVFTGAPVAVVEAYTLGTAGLWAHVTAVVLACGGLWSGAMLVREIARARTRRRARRAELRLRAPLLPGEEPGSDRLVVLEGDRPDAWCLPGTPPQLVVTTAALQRLKGRQLDAVLAHERGHARARHDWLLHCASALADGFRRCRCSPRSGTRCTGWWNWPRTTRRPAGSAKLTTALALVELNEDRGVFGPAPTAHAHVPARVHRLLTPGDRLPRAAASA